MTNSKNTRRALISSAFAILMCVAMLIGTTFAWFTDTAKTSVNKIQAGKLDVQLVDAEGNDLEGKTLEWVKAEGNDAVLWEPGCTYELPAVYVKNNGNLALKYKLAVTGLDGDAELLKAITFTVDGADLDTEKALAVGATSDPIVIKGHMDENAGNEYQGLSLDGIAITVVATQYTAEFDSYSNTYDKDAAYYTVNTAEELTASLTSANDGDIIALANSIEVASEDYNVSKRLEIAADNVTVDLNGKELTISNHTLTLTGDNITLKNGSVVATTTNASQTYGSYGIAVSGKNVTIDGVTVLGGISVTGYDVNDNLYDGVSATITNCNITATNYYTVCAQGQASAVVKNSTLTAENGYAFFWIEKAYTDDSCTVADSSLTYEEATVTMIGSKPLYNTSGLAPVAQ